MSQKYLKELIEFAQREMPSLQSDLQNASTQYSLQAATQRLFNVTTFMLHNLIHAACEPVAGSPAPAPAPAPVVAPVIAPVAVAAPVTPSGLPSLPRPGVITQPSPAVSSSPDMPDVPIEPGVANVIITSHGTKVISPSGVTTTVPPGEHVGLDATSSAPPIPYSAPGEQTVVLPPGGGLTPDVLAALHTPVAG